MFYLRCPYCQEERDEQEFSYSCEAGIERPTNSEAASSADWADYLFMRENRKGRQMEQWVHSAGCRKFFVVERDNLTNEVYGVFTCAEAVNPPKAVNKSPEVKS